MAMTFRNKMKKTRMRLSAAFRVLFGANHFFLVSFSRKELTKLVIEEDSNPDMIYCGMRPYIVKKAIIGMAEAVDRDELVLEKAAYQYETDEYIKKRSKRYFKKP